MNKFYIIIVGTAAVIFPLVLLVDVNAGFAIDWYNHLWLIGYYGQYFSVHHSMPLALNTHEILLNAYPTFYGHLLYSTLGLISSLTGPNLAVRLGLVILWALMFWLIYRVTVEFSQDKLIGLVLGCLVCWTIYPLTNLYNRSALTETFASGLIMCTFCSAVLMVAIPETRSRISYMLLTGLTYALSTEHPITLFFSIMFLGLMILVMTITWLTYQKQDAVLLTAISLVLVIFVILVISPWAYATLFFKDQLGILTRGHSAYFVDGENLFTHFAPFPFDYRSLFAGIDVSTPYLDAQMNVPLLLFLIALGIEAYANKSKILVSESRKQVGRRLFYTAIVLFCLATTLLVSGFLYRYIPILNIILFPYRSITYLDLTVLAAVLSLIMIFKGQFRSSNTRLVVITICLTLSFSNVLVKFSHVIPIIKVNGAGQECNNGQIDFTSISSVAKACWNLNPIDKSSFLSFPTTMYGANAYTIIYPGTRTGDSPVLSIQFKVGEGKNFGVAMPKIVHLSVPTWILTNISSSPWNRILVDQSPIPTSDMISNAGKMDVKIPAGKHVVEALFLPNKIYDILKKTRTLVLILWVCTSLGWLLFILARKMRLFI